MHLFQRFRLETAVAEFPTFGRAGPVAGTKKRVHVEKASRTKPSGHRLLPEGFRACFLRFRKRRAMGLVRSPGGLNRDSGPESFAPARSNKHCAEHRKIRGDWLKRNDSLRLQGPPTALMLRDENSILRGNSDLLRQSQGHPGFLLSD